MNRILPIYFIMLTIFSCNQQEKNKEVIEDFNIEFSKGTDSKEFEQNDTFILSNKNLDSIPYIYNIQEVKYLDLSHNNIKHLNWIPLLTDSNNNIIASNLEYLDLSFNNLDTGFFLFKTSWFPKLKVLNLSHNQLPAFVTASQDTFVQLDLSYNNLVIFRTGMNFLELNISNNPMLVEIRLDTTRVDKLNISRISDDVIFNVNVSQITVEIDEIKKKDMSDTLQLEYYKKKELVGDEFIGYDLLMKNYSFEQLSNFHFIDNEIEIHGLRGVCGGFIYSPDSTFKIFSIASELCGVYCNERKQHFVHYNLEENLQLSEIDLEFIDNIYKMPDGKYLILHSGGARVASGRGETYFVASLIYFENDSIKYHKIPMPNYNIGVKFIEEYIKKGELFFAQGHVVDYNSFMRYDTITNILSYRVANDLYWCCSIDSAYVFNGSYKYIDGNFLKINESIQPIEIDW